MQISKNVTIIEASFQNYANINNLQQFIDII